MSEEIVKFRGGIGGLQLLYSETADFAAVEKAVRAKLEAESKFFSEGTTIQIYTGGLTADQQENLRSLFKNHGVILQYTDVPPAERKAVPVNKAAREAKTTVNSELAQTSANEQKIGKMQEMLVIDRTVRGGEEITSKGSVLICGNVNPGAHIIAGGSIDIRGTCRGLVHAGAYGDTNAFIIADHLMPLQIRIADLIARSPDQLEKSERAERASIKEGQIIVEPIER